MLQKKQGDSSDLLDLLQQHRKAWMEVKCQIQMKMKHVNANKISLNGRNSDQQTLAMPSI